MGRSRSGRPAPRRSCVCTSLSAPAPCRCAPECWAERTTPRKRPLLKRTLNSLVPEVSRESRISRGLPCFESWIGWMVALETERQLTKVTQPIIGASFLPDRHCSLTLGYSRLAMAHLPGEPDYATPAFERVSPAAASCEACAVRRDDSEGPR